MTNHLNDKAAIRELSVIRGMLSGAVTRLFRVMESSGEIVMDTPYRGNKERLGIHLYGAAMSSFLLNKNLHELTNELREKAGMPPVEIGDVMQTFSDGWDELLEEARQELKLTSREVA